MIRTLYVDDDPDLLEIGRIYLERAHGLTVETERSVKNALAKIRTGSYDAIISDYSMPEMDGIRFLRKVRTCSRKIPFILFTGKGREEVVIDALNSGADFYLQKGGEPKAQFAELYSMIVQAVKRRRIEDELKTSEERYRNVVEDQTEAICRFLPDGTHVFVNEAYCRLVGKTKEELLGKKNPFVIYPDDRGGVCAHLQSLTPVKPCGILEHRINLPNHSVRWIRCSDRGFFDDDGKPREYQSVITDITDKKTAEAALEESRETFRYVIDFFPEAFYAVDKTGRVIVWNKAASDLTGVSEQEMLGKGNQAYAVPFYGKRRPCLVDNLIFPEKPEVPTGPAITREGKCLMAQTIITVRNGQEIPTRVKASPLYDPLGKMIGAIEVIRIPSGTVVTPCRNTPPGSGTCRSGAHERELATGLDGKKQGSRLTTVPGPVLPRGDTDKRPFEQ
ncbi:MAG: PAS domain S-box protein [Methanoregula sp.]|jgi:PAS domain S-box-containing protein